jgi:hypothetical protein
MTISHHVGNDIVDLGICLQEKKTENPRFLKKVLTAAEQAALARSDHPERLFWAFWAAKETAYKAVSKAYPPVCAIPRRYEVSLTEHAGGREARGRVETPRGVVGVRVVSDEEALHCIGSAGCRSVPEGLFHGFIRLVETGGAASSVSHARQSRAARKIAARSIRSRLGRKPSSVTIKRKRDARGKGPPLVFVNGARSFHDVSLSHHGRFAAYAAILFSSPASS